MIRFTIFSLALLTMPSYWVRADDQSASSKKSQTYVAAPQTGTMRAYPPPVDLSEYKAEQQRAMTRVLSGQDAKEKFKKVIEDSAVKKEIILLMPVTGPQSFRDRVRAALELLKTKSFSDYEYALKYVTAVEAGEFSAITARSAKPVYYLKHGTAVEASLTWLASTFVHEACHAEKARTPSKLVRVAKSAYELQQEEELKCNALQTLTLRKVGASASEIQYLDRANGLHFDVNHDGRFTEEDNRLQKW